MESVTLREYQAANSLKNQEEMAAHFGVAQSTMNRWLHRDDLYIGVSKNGRWRIVFVEQILKKR